MLMAEDKTYKTGMPRKADPPWARLLFGDDPWPMLLVIVAVGFLLYILARDALPAILGVVLANMMEENFVTSLIKSDGSLATFFTRPIAMWLAIFTFVIMFWPVIAWAWRRLVRAR